MSRYSTLRRTPARGRIRIMTIHGIELDSEAIRQFCKKWRIKELSVFGSILRGDFRPDSDVDFLVDFEEVDEDEEWDVLDALHMQEELACIVGRNVDLLTRPALELGGNPRFQREILRSSENIFVSR